jgi:hypothetical protein
MRNWKGSGRKVPGLIYVEQCRISAKPQSGESVSGPRFRWVTSGTKLGNVTVYAILLVNCKEGKRF